jgi:hypothetical protein
MKISFRFIRKILYATLIYSSLIVSYFFLQEFYVENCTFRAGIIQMIFGLPTCNHILKILQIVGEYSIAIFIGLTTFTTLSLR